MKECEICTPGTHKIRTAEDLDKTHPHPLPTKVLESLNVQFPEVAKWSAVCDTGANMVVQDFLEWLGSQDWFIATYKNPHGVELNHAVSVPLTHERLIYRFFGIDEQALERDRRDMLKLSYEMQERTG